MNFLATRFFWVMLSVFLCIAALFRMHLDGDGVEYLLTTHAFTEHASAAIHASDFAEFTSATNGRLEQGALDLLGQVPAQAAQRGALPFFGFAQAGSGEVYAIHFWMYSLLAAPVYAMLAALGSPLVWAFPLLNLAFAGAAMVYLKRTIPAVAWQAALVFISLGTIYYLRWSGPEVMSASCVFVAALCILRRDTSLAVFLCGLGATQNPSIALLIPFAAGHRLLPGLAPLPPVARSPRSQIALALAGVALALVPYAFYHAAFGIPSLTAKYFTDPGLISVRRLLSTLFDLDQGMLIGIPGMFAALALLPFLVQAEGRKPFLINGVLFAAASILIAVPALAASNWNSGASVMLRYAYWAAMPMVALIVSALPFLARRGRTALLATVLAAQLLAAVGTGLISRNNDYLAHTPLARWALENAAPYYHPDPEIFFERGRHSEAVTDRGDTQLVYKSAEAVKLLRHWTNTGSAGLCASGHVLGSSRIVDVDGGWQYLHAPFTCAATETIAGRSGTR